MELLIEKLTLLLYPGGFHYGNLELRMIVKARQMTTMINGRKTLMGIIQVIAFLYLRHQDYGRKKVNGLMPRKQRIIGKMSLSMMQ